VSLLSMPILWIFCLLMPGASIGTTIRLLFLCEGPSDVFASRQHQSAIKPFVIHICCRRSRSRRHPIWPWS
jgi:hypothetical protein